MSLAFQVFYAVQSALQKFESFICLADADLLQIMCILAAFSCAVRLAYIVYFTVECLSFLRDFFNKSSFPMQGACGRPNLVYYDFKNL